MTGAGAIGTEVARAMQAGADLVQASLEHLEEVERMWACSLR